MSLWARKATAYISSVFMAWLVLHFVNDLIGPVYAGDGVRGFVLVAVFLLVEMAAWMFLSAFLYSRLAPLEAIRPKPRKSHARNLASKP